MHAEGAHGGFHQWTEWRASFGPGSEAGGRRRAPQDAHVTEPGPLLRRQGS